MRNKLVWDKRTNALRYEEDIKADAKYSNRIALGGLMTMTSGIGFIIVVIYILQGKNEWLLSGLTLGCFALAIAGRIISKHFEDKRYEENKWKNRKN